MVEECGYNSSAGNFVRIRVSKHTVMSYCHFRDKLPWKAGETVEAGTILGFMGNTGNSSGAHLHWGVKVDGQWVDPKPYLDAEYEEDASMSNFKIALTAGHYKGTPGKRCLKSLDPNETREWVLNNRIADKVEELLTAYTGYQLLRTDDTTGEKDISLVARTNAANNFNADFYLSIHHNAGINGGTGGGIVAYIYTNASAESALWQKDLYNALIAETGLKGNRVSPMMKANYHEVRETHMPAVLLELGFMDSQTDVPVILTEEYAEKCARAIVKVLAERGKLTKKPTQPEVSNKLYRVQVGAYSVKANAEAMLQKVKAAGFADAFITEA